MKVDVQKLENNKLEIQVEVSEEKVAEALNKSYKKVVLKINVPGFRKGKVPRQILESRYGAEVLYDDAIDMLLPDAYEAALADSEAEPIDRPEVEVVSFEQGQPAVFKFTVQNPPEVELGQYKGVEVEAVSLPVTDEEMQKALENLQEQHARLVESSEETISADDYVTFDYEGFVDGVAFDGGKADNHTLQIGSGTFIPGFEEQMIGLSPNQQAEITVTFPEDYRAEHLAGKNAVFKLNIKDVKRKEVPALTDEFASEVSEFATMEELRADVQNKLEEAAAQRERNLLEAKVVGKAVENASVEVPNVLIEQEIDEMIEELKYNLTRQGFPAEFANEYIGSRVEELRNDYQVTAADRVKTRLVLNKIKEVENIAVAEEDIDAKLEEMSKMYQQEASKLREILEQQGNLDSLKNSIAMEKTVNMLIDAAIQVDAAVSSEEAASDSQE